MSIKRKDTIWLKIPYPSIKDTLADRPHMYICRAASKIKNEFVKCQTLKPYMIGNPDFKHYIDESADLRRNPFKHRTRIDCDKLFITSIFRVKECARTDYRTDICEELMQSIEKKLNEGSYEEIPISSEELIQINNKVEI